MTDEEAKKALADNFLLALTHINDMFKNYCKSAMQTQVPIDYINKVFEVYAENFKKAQE